MSKILWLASYPKSGNTWMRMFLSAYRNSGIVNINHTGPFAYDDMAKYTYQVISPKPYTELAPEEMAAVRGAYFVHLLNMGRGDRLFVKTHSCIGLLAEYPTIPEVFTEGGLYMVRDPRDVCVSYAHHCQMSIDETIDFMLKPAATINHDTRYHALGTWEEHVKTWVDKDIAFPRHIVRYEDMVNEPKKTFSRVVEFLGWDVDKDLVDKSIEGTEFSKLKHQEEKYGFREQSHSGAHFFRKGKIGSWKDEMTDKQVKRLTDAFAETMKPLGYEP